VLGGIVVGVAVAGVPSRGEDPPLRVDADALTSTTTTLLPTTVPTTLPPEPPPEESTTTTRVRR
jgi:hypothetical protein